MRIEGDTIIFRSAPNWYEVEKSGEKPNTLRLLDWHEVTEIAGTDLRKVRIEKNDGKESFTRPVGRIFNLEPLLGKTLVMVCWSPR